MRWAKNEATDKNIPLDPEPVEDGNLVLVRPTVGGAMVVRPLRKGEPDPDPSLPRYRPHFATCTVPEQFRKREGTTA